LCIILEKLTDNHYAEPLNCFVCWYGKKSSYV